MNHRQIMKACSVLVLALPLAASLAASSCGDATFYSCGYNALPDRKDDYGLEDPCCQSKPCCANPLWSHTGLVPGSVPPRRVEDPCCRIEECPEHNIFATDAGCPNPAPDAGDTPKPDASACNTPCDGTCIPRAPMPFAGPVLLARTEVGEEPTCPVGTTKVLSTHYADLDVPPLACPGCACDAPTGTCTLPTKITASSVLSSQMNDAAIQTDFSAPNGWDGSCTNENAIPAGALCNGIPCVHSLQTAPLTMKQGDCSARTKPAPRPAAPPSWKTAATLCQLAACSGAPGEDGLCLSKTVPAAIGWETCVIATGADAVCATPYPKKHVVYERFADGRTCAGCQCSPPSGGQCASLLTVYGTSDCSGTTTLGLLIGSETDRPSYWSDLLPGLALGSKKMSTPIYTPGTCDPSGGGELGEVAAEGALTLCCGKA
jgi:hypothetical protein